MRDLEEIKLNLQNEIQEKRNSLKCEYTVILAENECDSRDQKTY